MRLFRILVASLLGAAAPALAQPNDAAPEAATVRQEREVVRARHFMVVTANPFASRAGDEILRAGGSALDAAIAAQMVLNLTEPQSSGIGGGGFLMHWDGARHELTSYDGRETAPAAARPDRFLAPGGKPLPFALAVESGLSVGVPGILRMLELAHAKHGRLPWARLFQPAIRLAENGFPVSPRLHALVAGDPALARNAAARAYFYGEDGKALPVGHVLRNPAFAAVLRRVAQEGPDAFYRGEVARDIVAAVASHPRPGDLTEADLAGYRALERKPLCGSYRGYRVCSVPPPSSGGIGVIELLGLLERFDLAALRPGSSAAVHLFSEAGRLAYADRDYYVGDPAFVDVPAAGLIEPGYLRRRSGLIRRERSMGRASPGEPRGARHALGADATIEAAGTSHLSVVDASGNAVAFTTTIEYQFGSHIFVRGFLLNNQLTDFSFLPEEGGRPLANRVEPGKRPRSTLAPTLVFGPDGALRMSLGSPGGSQIINFVAKTLVCLIDWKMDIQQAAATPNMGSRNHATEIEKGSALEDVAAALRAMGHTVTAMDLASGVHGIVAAPAGRGLAPLTGGADPRREGLAIGE